MGIKLIKDRKVRDYTFIDDNSLNLDKSLAGNKVSSPNKDKTKRDPPVTEPGPFPTGPRQRSSVLCNQRP